MSSELLKRVRSLRGLTLRTQQQSALEQMHRYLEAWESKATNKSALVQMPTGAGKSGVIALLANFGVPDGLRLVLTPRTSLRQQLARDLAGRFFEHAGAADAELIRTVEVAEGGRLQCSDLESDCALIMTMQMLASIARNRQDLFQKLVDRVGLVLVDEGHYEPAPDWSGAVREFTCPRVVFTATPYRNDFKSFDVDADHVSVLSYGECVADELLRRVEFKEIQFGTAPDEFGAVLVSEVDRLADRLSDDFRVIVRCRTASDIRDVCQGLAALSQTVVGVHDTFTDTPGWERRNVPKPEDECARYWVHQYKLLEGIDDHRFQVLALHGSLRSARSLVQQIGRVVRNPRREDSSAFVVERRGSGQREMWESFLQYDSRADSVENVRAIMGAGDAYLRAVADAMPAAVYADGQFRTPLELAALQPETDIQLPLAAVWRLKQDTFNLDSAANAISEVLADADSLVHVHRGDGWRLIVAVAAKNSPYLANHLFLEPRVGLTVIREFGSLVSSQGADGIIVDLAEKLGLGPVVSSVELERLFDTAARFTSVSLFNSNMGSSVVRSQTLNAVSIADTLGGFADYAQICTRAEGYSPSGLDPDRDVRKYVGFRRGLVSERSQFVSFGEYLSWLDSTAEALAQPSVPASVFRRYAQVSAAPEKPEPISILMDLAALEDDFVLRGDTAAFIDIEDTCVPVSAGSFELIANKTPVRCTIEFDEQRSKYFVDSPQLSRLYTAAGEASIGGDLVSRINAVQAFQVLPESTDRVYALGAFFDPRIQTGPGYKREQDPVGSCLVGMDAFASVTTEKGKADYWTGEVKDTWDPDSIFGLVASRGRGTPMEESLKDATFIVCDDLQNEIADFIVCREGDDPFVAFVHAKADVEKATVGCATSALHDVCSQATKNLGYMAAYHDQPPPNLSSWGRRWRASDRAVVRSRVIGEKDTPSHLWHRTRAIINDPRAQKELWIAATNTVSKDFYLNQMKMRRNRVAPQVFLAAVLLKSTLATAGSLGVRMKVFCNT